MDWPIHHIDSPPSQEELRSLRLFEVKKKLWTLIFNSLIDLPNGENVAEDIIEWYENSSIVKSFDELFTFLVQSEHILSYSVSQLEQFYKSHFIASSFDSCLAIFDKWPFAKSFYIAMYGDVFTYPKRDILIAIRVLEQMKPIHQKFLAKQMLSYADWKN
jgi:hypothetical protein